MPNLLLLRGLTSAVLIAVVCPRCPAQQPYGPGANPVPEYSSSPTATPTILPGDHEPPGAMVLLGGRLVEGRIRETAGGFVVELPKGRYVVPSERVLLTARDRTHAYEKQRGTMRPPSPTSHYELATWCLRYGMHAEAKIELRDALQLAANFSPARQLLKDIEDLERPADPRHERSEPFARRTVDGFEVPETTSVAGLSAESVATFTARVQPLLVNGCANARCHGGSSDNGFHVERIAFGRAGNRATTIRNLAATLQYVDPRRPEESPLLTKPSGLHGGAIRPMFLGSSGERQRELLRDWLQAVSADLGKNQGDEQLPALVERNHVATPPAMRTSDTPRRRSEASAPDLLDRILDEERPDAFDPDAFNRASTSIVPPPGR